MKTKVEIKQISDREFLIGESKYYLGEDDILYVTQIGDIDEIIIVKYKETIFKLMNLVEGKVDAIIDLNKTRKQSPTARKAWKELNENKKVGKVALYGLHPVSRVIASFVIGVSQKKDMQFFKTKEEALKWIKG